MNTPICNFVSRYAQISALRLHMPGHKGINILGCETLDITEIEGADSLFEASGIIKESEENASQLFGCSTFYSTEGSSLCIRAMLYLATLYAKEHNLSTKILAGRNAHKTFLSAVALLDLDIDWLYDEDENSYLSCTISPEKLDKKLNEYTSQKPMALYITSPDYLGNIADISSLSAICRKHGVLLLTDNAHGAYLKFLPKSQHPIDLGADMCCDSAHKTLPVLTSGAYLHINDNTKGLPISQAKAALSLFGSTSPSYLTLQSLDYANKYLSEEYPNALCDFLPYVRNLRQELIAHGYKLQGNEELKLTLCTKDYGYTGEDLARILKSNNIVCEFADPDFVVLMISVQTGIENLQLLKNVLLSIPQLDPIIQAPPAQHVHTKAMSVREALISPCETLPARECRGRILASVSVGCPPAVCVIVSGEIIDNETLNILDYYSNTHCTVVK